MGKRLENKIALITGGAAGFGKGTAAVLKREGAKVYISDINKEGGEKVASELGVSFFEHDVTDPERWQEVIAEIKTADNQLNILVNNAGTNIPEHFTKVKRKDMEYVVKINTMATFNIAQLSALKMIELKNRKKVGGVIINMSSQMGHVGGPIRSVYNMTKFGFEGLTKGMSIDLAKHNIRVNTVCPTFVVTPMTSKFLKDKKFMREVLGNIPLGRFAELSDVASAVVFLASDQASMITGTSLLVDGGWTSK